MYRRLISFTLSLLLIVGAATIPAFADESTTADPAPTQTIYEFDGVKYVNVGSGDFSTSQTDYYHSMLDSSLNKNGASFDRNPTYSVNDLWTVLGMKALCTCDRSDALGSNLFKVESIDFYPVNTATAAIYDSHNTEVNELITRLTPADGKWTSSGIDFKFYREPLGSATTSQAFAETVARTAASQMVNRDGVEMGRGNSLPVTVTEGKAPDLNGPIYYSFVGASGVDLELFPGAYTGQDFHGAVIAFSDFSITPVIPNENDSEPYAYIRTTIGSVVKDEQKTVSDVKNDSDETVTASQSITETKSSTVTSSINGSQGTSTTDSYGCSETIKVGAKFTLEKVFEAGGEASSTISEDHSTTETVSKGWSSSEGTTKSEDKERTVSVSLPPYTTALISQQHIVSEEQVKYNCPVALNYKVTIYYVYGTISRSGSSVTATDISFDKLTTFGASSDARADLAKRYADGTGTSHMVDADGLNWGKLKEGSAEYAIDTLSTVVPFDSTSATFTAEIDAVRQAVDEILPLHPIDTIKFVNPNSVLQNDPWLTEITMKKGETAFVSKYGLKALNEYGADFHTFNKARGSFVFLDANGNDITATGNSVIKPVKDAVSGELKFTAVGKGTAYLRYKINSGLYKTASMAASNTPEDTIDDSEVPHPAILQITVTDTGTVVKKANPLAMKGKTAKVKLSKLKKKSQTLAVSKVIKFTKDAKDKKTYTLSTAKRGSKSFKKYFRINKKTGKVTVRKGLKKGTYKVKVKVKAAGNATYKPSTVKVVTFKIKVV